MSRQICQIVLPYTDTTDCNSQCPALHALAIRNDVRMYIIAPNKRLARSCMDEKRSSFGIRFVPDNLPALVIG